MNLHFAALALSEVLSQYSVRILLGGIVAVFGLLIFASHVHHRFHFTKKAFYSSIAFVVLACTSALMIINIQLITNSEDGAITRLSGNMSVFACGLEIPIQPNNSFLNQSSGDSRHKVFSNGKIEFLGYRTEPETDGTLGAFFRSIGGSVSANIVALPFGESISDDIANNVALAKFVKTNPLGEKYLELRSGESCNDTPSMVNVFVYEHSPTLQSFKQTRITTSPEKYLLTDKRFSEPDCIVIVFGNPSQQTDLTCRGYPASNKIYKGLPNGVEL